MGKSLLTVDNILILGAVGAGAAYFTDFQGFKGMVDQAIADLMAALKLGGGGTVDCVANPADPSCTGGGGGGGCDDPACTSECCKCKCSDRVNCPEGTCCDRCRTQCPAQCAGAALAYARTGRAYIPDNMDGRRRY